MMSADKRQRGVALFQVLLMTAIFSMLLLLMVANVQQNQRQTQQLLDATEQQLVLYSAMNRISFALLTEEWQGPGSGEERYGWNFYGYRFNWPQQQAAAATDALTIEVQLQDINGLFDLRFPTTLLQQWLVQHGIASLDAASMITTLRDAQRAEPAAALPFAAPGLYLQQVSEVQALPGWQRQVSTQLLPFSRMHGDDFNYLTAPDPLLAALLPPAQFDILRQWREQGRVDRFRFSELTGLEPAEGATFFPGRELIMVLRLGQQQRRWQLRIDNAAAVPLLIRQQQRG